ncbi:MAG: hypothetical protein Pg6A_19990 [Termitinemataceae bacterium]|nr:MAG: hypothetical protein Pg6A_19990 [Termitinemataceae bacterium]
MELAAKTYVDRRLNIRQYADLNDLQTQLPTGEANVLYILQDGSLYYWDVGTSAYENATGSSYVLRTSPITQALSTSLSLQAGTDAAGNPFQLLANDGTADHSLIGYHDYHGWNAVEVGNEEHPLTLNSVESAGTFGVNNKPLDGRPLFNYKNAGGVTQPSDAIALVDRDISGIRTVPASYTADTMNGNVTLQLEDTVLIGGHTAVLSLIYSYTGPPAGDNTQLFRIRVPNASAIRGLNYVIQFNCAQLGSGAYLLRCAADVDSIIGDEIMCATNGGSWVMTGIQQARIKIMLPASVMGL